MWIVWGYDGRMGNELNELNELNGLNGSWLESWFVVSIFH